MAHDPDHCAIIAATADALITSIVDYSNTATSEASF
jgi:hypothetical protein